MKNWKSGLIWVPSLQISIRKENLRRSEVEIFLFFYFFNLLFQIACWGSCSIAIEINHPPGTNGTLERKLNLNFFLLYRKLSQLVSVQSINHISFVFTLTNNKSNQILL